MRSQQTLFYRYFEHLPNGHVDWIGVRPARKAAMQAKHTAQAIEGLGLVGDHRCTKTPGSARQVTFISKEHIALIRTLMNQDDIQAADLRRNIVIKQVNIHLLRHQYFQIGEAIFLGTALCHPCSRMDQVLGKGGAGMMYGYGGLCAKIIRSGQFAIGDEIHVLPPSDDGQLPLL